MKRILIFTLIAILIFTSAAVYAASSASFRISGCEIAENRLFTVEVSAASDVSLCAALFEFSYDSSAFEFREASAEKPAVVEANDDDGVLRLSYFNSDGADCGGEAVLFTLTFKAKQSGSYTLGCTVFQCVDSDASNMPVGEVKSEVITVTGKDVSSKTSKSSGTSSKSGKESSSPEKNSTIAPQETTAENAGQLLKNYGVHDSYNSYDVPRVNLTAVIILCISCMAVSAGGIFAVMKLRSVIKERKNLSKDGKTPDDE